MKRYLKLVNFEFNRFFKLYLVLIGITILVQLSGVIFESNKFVSQANKEMQENLLSTNEFLSSFGGPITFESISTTLWIIGPIAICCFTLILYVFFIWYRDWVGKNTFSYRLLMLPTARLNIYLAKATTILLFVLGLIALQLLLLIVENGIFNMIVPDEFRLDFTINEITKLFLLNVIFPKNFLEFILYYVVGMTAVFLLFTAILFERSYRFKGIFYAIVYCIVSIGVFFAPIIVQAFVLENFFYPIELLWLEIVASMIVLAGAIAIGNILIKKKVRV